MNRKLIAALAVVVPVLIVMWYARAGDRLAPGGAVPLGGDARRAVVAGSRSAAIRGGAASPTTDAGGAVRLEGQVLGPDGSGVGGAEVRLSTIPPTEVVSEADGSFTFERLVSQTYAVTAIAGELIGGPVVARIAADSEPVVVRLAQGAALAVHVVNDRDEPVVAAAVTVVDTTDRTVRTDESGTAVVKPVRPASVAITVFAVGYATTSAITPISRAGTTGELTITLHAGYSASGRVLDERGQPIAGAEITSADGIAGAGTAGIRVETDDAGEFTVPAFAPGPHTLLASDGEHAPAESSIAIADHSIAGVEITMTAGGVVAGHVVATDATSVSSATVRLVGSSRSGRTVVRELTSDTHGGFEARGLPRTALHLQAEASRAASSILDIDLASVVAARDVRLVLDDIAEISGVVVDAKGHPLAEVQVTAFRNAVENGATGRTALSAPSSATSDGSGAFSIRGLRVGAYQLFATSELPGLRNAGVQGTPATTGAKDVRIALVAAGGIRGRLQFAGTGRAPARAVVQLGSQAPMPVIVGTFEAVDVTPGRYDVALRGDEFAELIKRDVSIEAGRTTDLGTIDVSVGRTLTGTVVDESGAPVAGAQVRSGNTWRYQTTAASVVNAGATPGSQSAISDRDGRFTITGVPSGITSVAADHALRGRSIARTIEDGGADPPPVTLVLHGHGSIAGTVTMRGRAQGGAMITVVSKDGAPQPLVARADGDGTFVLAEVLAGEHLVSALQPMSGPSSASTSITVSVAAGRQTKVILDIQAGTRDDPTDAQGPANRYGRRRPR